MKTTKKLQHQKLGEFSTVFTLIGLVLVLFVVHLLLEHKTSQTSIIIDDSENKQPIVYLEETTDIIYTKEPKKTPISSPTKTPMILDEIKIDDTQKTETMNNFTIEEPTLIEDVNILEVKDPDDITPETVPFIKIEDAPIFKGCEGLSKEENKSCFEQKMRRFIQKNFDASLAEELGLKSGRVRISSQFIINKKGLIEDIKVRAPHPKLAKETTRVIQKMPQFTPGKQRKKPVKMRYTLPITFRVD